MGGPWVDGWAMGHWMDGWAHEWVVEALPVEALWRTWVHEGSLRHHTHPWVIGWVNQNRGPEGHDAMRLRRALALAALALLLVLLGLGLGLGLVLVPRLQGPEEGRAAPAP